MNLTALQARCALRYRDTGNRLVTTADWTEYLNDAYTEVLGAEPNWPFLQGQTSGLTVNAGTGTVALPTDVWRVTGIFNATDKWPLAPLPGQIDYREWFPDPAGSLGTPEFYRLRGSTLEVYPWPAVDTSLTVDTIVPPALLSAGGDVPVFPSQYHRLLVYGALARVYEDDRETGPSGTNQGRFAQMLQQMRNDLLGPRTEGFAPVLDTFF